MGYKRNVCGMELSITQEGWRGEHPLGSMVNFHSYKNIHTTKRGKKKVVTKKWNWSYEGADSGHHKSLTAAVENWRATMGLPLPRKETVK